MSRLVFLVGEEGVTCPQMFLGRSLLVRCRRVGLVRSNEDPKIRACEMYPLSLSKGHARFCQNRGTWLFRLRQRKPCPMITKSDFGNPAVMSTTDVLCLFDRLNTSEVGTSMLLTVSRTYVHTLCRTPMSKGLLAWISGHLWQSVLVQEKGFYASGLL